jgi:hypothetical protein
VDQHEVLVSPLMPALRSLFPDAAGLMEVESMGPSLPRGNGRDGTLEGLVMSDFALFAFELHLNKALPLCLATERNRGVRHFLSGTWNPPPHVLMRPVYERVSRAFVFVETP